MAGAEPAEAWEKAGAAEARNKDKTVRAEKRTVNSFFVMRISPLNPA
jgi:hypothetical protein